MPAAQEGDTVRVHYKGTLEDGTEFDSSTGRDPLEFTVGQGQVIPGFERAVVGLEPGAKATEKIASEEAYGPRRDELVQDVPKEQLPDDLEPEVGQVLAVQGPTGDQGQVVVAAVNDDTVTLDGNHPLAGRDLTFEIELLEIV